MNKKLISKIFLFWIGIILLLGIYLKNGRLHIWGKGVEYENELTFGLTKLLNLQSITFYEMNFIFSSLTISGIIFLILMSSFYYKRKDDLFDSFYSISLITLVIPIAVLIWNFQEIRNVHPSEKKYTKRYFENLDDSIRTNKQVVVQLDEIDFQICFYSLILFFVSTIGIIIKFIFPKNEFELQQIDHLIEKELDSK